MAYTFEYLFMYAHHLIGVHEAPRVDKYMSYNRSGSDIFFDDKCEHSIVRKFFSVLQCITSDDTDTRCIEIKRIESEFERLLADTITTDFEDLSWSDTDIFFFERIRKRCSDQGLLWRWRRIFDRAHMNSISKRTSSETQRKTMRSLFDSKFCDFFGSRTWGKKIKKSALFEKTWIFYIIANICNSISRSIYKRKSEKFKYHLK